VFVDAEVAGGGTITEVDIEFGTGVADVVTVDKELVRIGRRFFLLDLNVSVDDVGEHSQK
jgi:hypothetical protein